MSIGLPLPLARSLLVPASRTGQPTVERATSPERWSSGSAWVAPTSGSSTRSCSSPGSSSVRRPTASSASLPDSCSGSSLIGRTLELSAALNATLAEVERRRTLAAMILEGEGLAELHTHLGGAVAPDILWSIAHDRASSCPVSTYWEFRELVTDTAPDTVRSLGQDCLVHILATEPRRFSRRHAAIERSVYDGIIGKEFRSELGHVDRAALQPDEAQPWRRARPRPHHPRGTARHRSGLPGVGARTRRPDPDDGSNVRPPPERDHRGQGDQLGRARSGRNRHRRPSTRRRSLRLRADRAASSRPRAMRGSA